MVKEKQQTPMVILFLKSLMMMDLLNLKSLNSNLSSMKLGY